MHDVSVERRRRLLRGESSARNQSASDSDSGTVELGGEFVTFRGRNHVVRYRFLNLQQAIDGSTVLTFLPPEQDASRINFIRDSQYWVRKR